MNDDDKTQTLSHDDDDLIDHLSTNHALIAALWIRKKLTIEKYQRSDANFRTLYFSAITIRFVYIYLTYSGLTMLVN